MLLIEPRAQRSMGRCAAPRSRDGARPSMIRRWKVS